MDILNQQPQTADEESAPKYDVLLVECDPFRHVPILKALMMKEPMPNFTFFQASNALRNMPFRVKQCVPIQVAVTIEMALEIVGATVEIMPANDC